MSRINKIENKVFSCCKENEEKVTTKKPPTKRFTTTTSRAILDNGIEESMTKCKLYYFFAYWPEFSKGHGIGCGSNYLPRYINLRAVLKVDFSPKVLMHSSFNQTHEPFIFLNLKV